MSFTISLASNGYAVKAQPSCARKLLPWQAKQTLTLLDRVHSKRYRQSEVDGDGSAQIVDPDK